MYRPKLNLPTFIFVGLLSMIFYARALNAQDQVQPQPGGRAGANTIRGMSPDKQLERLTKTLNLTADQQSQIKPILENQQQQMTQIHQEDALSRVDKMTKAKSLHEDTTSKIEAVLNADQKQKYEVMQQQMQERMKGSAPTSPQ
jgi:periplasmic protein CpxP/Spy